ncbi:right-handed parallel beta-helix repeat-containing protein [Saccharicrinis sp. FJH62]|uniref:right-handed parallel beta-helix repeat-containing protein n=1 Tax=Saccharicrinis sp. FJH62 TaxID=3344657 RepID=UPI0035D3FC98
MKTVKIISIFLLLPFTFFAKNYYVSTAGNDANDGLSPDKPWRSLAMVEGASLFAGDNVFLNGNDVFTESLTLSSKFGTASSPIKITSYGSGKAVISGSNELTGWINEGGNIWSATVSETAYQLFKNGNPLTTARIPEIKDKYAGELNFYHITTVINSNYSFTSEDLIGAPDLTGATLHVGTWEWLLKTAKISAFDSSTGKVTVATDIFDVFHVGNRFFINDDWDLLNSEGDWIYDAANNKVYLYSASVPSGMAYANKSEYGITIKSGSNVTVENLIIQHFNDGGIYSSGTTNLKIINCQIIDNYKDGIRLQDGEKSYIDSCEVTGTTEIAIRNNNDYSKISNCDVHDVGLSSYLNKEGYITGFAISSVGYMDSIINNKVTDIGYNAISFKDHATVENNVVKYVNLTTIDGGAIYSYQGKGGTIKNNIVICHPNITELKSNGIYMDNYTHDVDISGNTVIGFNNNIFVNKNAYSISIRNNIAYDASSAGCLITTAKSIQFYNNTVFNIESNTPPLYVTGITDWSNLKCDSNLYYNTSGFATAYISSDGYYGLKEWQYKTNNDLHSRENSALYIGCNIKEKNEVLNSGFNSDLSGWTSWASVATLKDRSGVTGNKCVYDTLAAGKTYGSLKVSNLKMEEGKDYVLEFDMKTNRTSLGYIDLKTENGFSILDAYRFFIKPDWETYRIPIKNITEGGNDISLQYYCGFSSFSNSTPNAFYLDNVKLIEAELDSTNNFTIAYNETGTEKTFNLYGSWKCIYDNLYSNNLVLEPYKALILFKVEPISYNLNLQKGWNYMSLLLQPEIQDINVIFQPLINDGTLIKVQDQFGSSLEYSGNQYGWVNNIGSVSTDKAYKVKVSKDCSLTIYGYETEPSTSIILSKGWNLIPYNLSSEKDALTVLMPLIKEGSLIKVEDNLYHTIAKTESGEWVNSIGKLIPGSGYEINVNKDTKIDIR